MNNSKIVLDKISISLDEPVDRTEELRATETRLVKIIEAIDGVKNSRDWSTLKSLIFDGEVASLEKRLRNEAEKLELDTAQIHILQGKLFWARKYADLDKLADSYRQELSNIKRLTQRTEASLLED